MNQIFSKNQVNFYTCGESDENQRLDNLLLKLFKHVPKAHLYRIIRNNEVRVNKKRVAVNYRVHVGDLVRIPPIDTVETAKKPILPTIVHADYFPIIYEDEYYLIINKPSGVACHGGSGINFGVIEQLRHKYHTYKFLELAHRLDRETSGLLVLAKKRSALVELQQLSKTNQIKKQYLALTSGVLPKSNYHVDVPLHKYVTKEGERRVTVDKNIGQNAYTIFEILEKYDANTLVKAILKTGRTHQIRVHLQYLGYPIVGDSKYGNFALNKELTKHGLKRMFLHAHQLQFVHPITKNTLKLTAELPDNLEQMLHSLRKSNNS